jgi:hypothetical protein
MIGSEQPQSSQTGAASRQARYPPASGFVQSSKYIKEQFDGLSADVVHKITCKNAAKFYGLIN